MNRLGSSLSDYFAILGEPRRPWIDAEALKQKFLGLSSDVHPDRVHGASTEIQAAAHQRYVELNAAYRCLREPKDRLLHLLQLELGAKPREVEQIAPDLVDFFLTISGELQRVDAVLSDKARLASPLLKVQWFERATEWPEKLRALQQSIQRRRSTLEQELQSMNRAWEAAPALEDPSRFRALPLKRLEEIYRELSYYHRWSAQIQERLTQLAVS